jgi:phospholipid-binding lipoprotein MlaA
LQPLAVLRAVAGARLAIAVMLVALVSGCATLPAGQRDPRDPWERVNRSVWTFDYAFDRTIYRPVARGYVKVTPGPVQQGLRNFLDNLLYTDTILNEFLQGKVRYGGADIGRLLVNTVFGLGGLFDPATRLNFDKHSADVGQTLGIWGLPSGPFVMIPFYGPSDVRDTFGLAADEYSTPRPYLSNQYLFWSLWLVDKIDERARLLSEDSLIDSAYDPYAFVRNAYLQHRDFLVHGSQTEVPQPEVPQELPEEPPGSAPDSGSSGGAPAPAHALPVHSTLLSRQRR